MLPPLSPRRVAQIIAPLSIKHPFNSRMNDSQPPVSEFKSKSGLKRIYMALGYSMAGFRTAWRIEHAFRQELFVVIAGTITALLLPVSPFEKLLLIAVFVLVLVVELLNSAIEAVVDRVSLERNPLSKNAKDFGSAAVLLTLLLAAATWLVILWPLLFD
jgi:diacylglycerol kinase (ATP)